MKFLDSAEVDTRLSWAIGRAERLARRGKLPHIRLPDGSVRFLWADIRALIKRVPEQRKGVSNGK